MTPSRYRYSSLFKTAASVLMTLVLAACTAVPTPTQAPVVEPTVIPATATPKPAEPTMAPEPTAIPATDTPAPIVIKDALDREVMLATAPERIVFAGKALFMVADAAYMFPGAADKIVGIGNTGQGSFNFVSLIDPGYDAKQVLDKDAGAEQIAALKPDLVVLKSSVAESLGAPIEALDIPVVYVDLETPETYFRDLGILGQVFQDEARASEVTGYIQDKMESIKTTTARAASKPSVLVLYYNDKDGNIAFNVPPAGWMQTQMAEMAGGAPVWLDANPGGGWAQVTVEQIAAWDPEQIYVIAYFANPSDVVAGLKTDANWAGLQAVKNGTIYAFPGDMYSWDQPDTRWILGLTWMAGKVHPELFADLDMNMELSAFYSTLYGLDDAFVIENIQPALRGDIP